MGAQQLSGSALCQERQMKTAAHGTVIQLRATRAALEDGVKKHTEENLQKRPRMEIGQREMEER